jgi:RHS repeat-associated protein
MYFDKNMNVIPTQSGIIQVGESNTLGQLAQNGIVARSDGFFYTYVTNRSEGVVYFDNLSIKHWAPMVRVTYDYYPYGLTWENPKLPTDPNAVHDQAYQGKEFQFAEFTTGHGLALYDFHARMYDPCTARWLVPDPAAQFANPYLAMENSPVTFTDPDGQWVQYVVGAFFGGIAGSQYANAQGFTGWKKFGFIAGAALIGAASAGAGVAIAGSGITAANTISTVVASSINSMGMAVLTKGNMVPSISFGFCSINPQSGEFNRLRIKGNSLLDNVGFALGAIANFNDIMAGVRPGSVKLLTETDPDYQKLSIDENGDEAFAAHKDNVGHSQITDTDDNLLIDWGPDGDVNLFSSTEGTNEFRHGNLIGPDKLRGEPVIIKGVNVDKIKEFGVSLKGKQYAPMYNNCSMAASRSLSLSGAVNIGLHPYVLDIEMYVRSIGFRPTIQSYFLTGNQ